MGTLKPLVKLNQDEREMILEVISSPGWTVLLKTCEQLVRRRGEDVLTIEDERLIKARAEYNGAKALLNQIKTLNEILKLSPED